MIMKATEYGHLLVYRSYSGLCERCAKYIIKTYH